MTWTEFRKYPRSQVDIPADCTWEGITHHSRALSLGGGGLFVQVAKPIAPDTELTVRFRPAGHLPVVEAKAQVRYCLPGRGVGVEFTEIRPEIRQKILRLILQRLEERRRFPRAPFAAQVEYEGGMLIGFGRSLCVGGMFIEAKKPLTPGSQLRVRFHLGDGGPIIVATAEVKYSVAKVGMGVEFVGLSPADLKRIDDYVGDEKAWIQ
jgi:PilZ domain